MLDVQSTKGISVEIWDWLPSMVSSGHNQFKTLLPYSLLLRRFPFNNSFHPFELYALTDWNETF